MDADQCRELADELHHVARELKAYVRRDIEAQPDYQALAEPEKAEALQHAAEHHTLADEIWNVEELARKLDDQADELALDESAPRFVLTEAGRQLLLRARHEPTEAKPKA